MPVVFLYLFKLSLSLAVVYLFYHFVLRRLTFYNWNRFYLIAYTALSFFIPFINITPVLERNEMVNNKALQFIPSFTTLGNANNIMPVSTDRAVSFSLWDWTLLLFAAGVLVMLTRMLLQLFSFRKMVNKATLISNDRVKLYQVNKPIIPFSFGNSIFINQQQHGEKELEEIIRHEFVHIRQKHTVDIIWSELLCILNWYNPFVWLIRKSIRQNLEFIADDKVLQSGIDKKQYQYLLLKVTGNNYFSIASQFNFSSLKKRIAMMNKMKSAGVHLLKFLFVLPLMTILILSFRNTTRDTSVSESVFPVQGIVYDIDTKSPVADVLIVDSVSRIQTTSDANGFYVMNLPVNKNSKADFTLSFSREDYKFSKERFAKAYASELSQIRLIGILNADSRGTKNKLSQFDARDGNGQFVTKPDYKFVSTLFKQAILMQRVDDIVGNSEKPIWVIENIPFAISLGSKASFSKEEVEQSPEFRVWVDGEIMTMDEANMKVRRSDVKSVGAAGIAFAKKYHNVNYNLLFLSINKWVDYIENSDGSIKEVKLKSRVNSDTIPKEQSISLSRNDKMDEAHKSFFEKNKKVKLLYWMDDLNTLEIYLDNGSIDKYNLKDKQSIKEGEAKYGTLPLPAMGGYRVFTNKGNSLILKENSGSYVVIVGDKDYKEIARVPLDDWNKKKKYYENLYGETPPLFYTLEQRIKMKAG